MPRSAAPSAPGEGPQERPPAPSAPGGYEYIRGPAPSSLGSSPHHTVIVDPCVATANPGEQFTINVAVYNDGGQDLDLSVVIPQLPDMEETYWRIEKSDTTVTTSSEGTTLFGNGSINDTLHLPWGTSAVYVFGLRCKINAPIGTEFNLIATVDGTQYIQAVTVLRDRFIDGRNQTDVRVMLEALFGLDEDSGQCGVTKMQDHMNQGVRLYHIMQDLVDRRGYPDRVSACNCTELNPATAGESIPCPIHTPLQITSEDALFAATISGRPEVVAE